MIVHRLARAAFTGLDGQGARLYGGRWTSPGTPAIYAAASPSLSVLEVLVHLDLPPELMPSDYRLLTIEIPDEAPFEELASPPADDPACRAAGDGFLQRAQAIVLLVPSVVVPQERNAILNPRHPAMAGVRILADDPFRFDPRLLNPVRR